MAFKSDSTSFVDVCKKIDAQGMKTFTPPDIWCGSVTYPILTYLLDTHRIERPKKGSYRKVSPEPLMELVNNGTMKQSDVWENMRTRTPTRPGAVGLDRKRKKGNGQAPPEPAKAEPEPTPPAELTVLDQLEVALKKVQEIPDVLATVYEALLTVCFDAEGDILDIAERRLRQVENLTSLLRTSKVELHAKNRRIEELKAELTKLAGQKLKVVEPPPRILIRDGSERQSPQWGKS